VSLEHAGAAGVACLIQSYELKARCCSELSSAIDRAASPALLEFGTDRLGMVTIARTVTFVRSLVVDSVITEQ
jgi:hypothetical protein